MERDSWSGKVGFVLAAAGSAVGLGNLWKFPYITWANGGGLFVIVYLVCIVIVGLPIMMCELSMGKLSEKDPVGAFKALGGKTTPFRFVGLLGVLSGFVILSYYSVVAGWSMQYTLFAAGDKFAIVPESKVEQLAGDNKEFVLRETFKKSLAESMTVATQMQLKVDATAASDKSISDDLLKNPTVLAEKLKKKGRLAYWEQRFFREQSQTDDYHAWLQTALLPVHSDAMFGEFVSSKGQVGLWHFAFMFIVLMIVMGGIKGGIEKASMVLMPTLLLLMLIMMFNSLSIDKNSQALSFLAIGNPAKFQWGKSELEALGHAFFTLSLGMGAMMTYGSYMKKDSNVVSDSMLVVSMDTLIAIMACLVIFPIIFVHGMEPKQSIGILFTALPLELSRLPFGSTLIIVFYLLVFFAALTSAISLLEVVVTFFVDERGLSRAKSTMIAGGLIFLCGIPSAININFLGMGDDFASRIMLPLGGLLTAIFVGYKVDMAKIKELFDKFDYPPWMFQGFRVTLRFVTPVLISVVFLNLAYQYFK